MRLTKPLFWLLSLLWFAAGAFWYSNYNKCTFCSNTASTTASTTGITDNASTNSLANNAAATRSSFSIMDSSSNWSLSSTGNLQFAKSNHLPVLNTCISSLLDSVAVYAKNNSTKKLTVTGLYKAEETNSTQFANLGFARAEELKKYFTNKGVAEKNILTASRLDSSLVFTATDSLLGGFSMSFADAIAAATAINAVNNNVDVPASDDLFKPRTIYFYTSKSTMPVDASFMNYIRQAKKYLDSHPDKKLLITGYTDNVGDSLVNMELSAGRAAFVKNNLVNKGIKESMMVSSGKGMQEPAEDNSTVEGRAKNRRVVIQLL